MKSYKSKNALKEAINKAYMKYDQEFIGIPEAMKDVRIEGVDRTPAENLAYQVGWTTLLLKWESDEQEGKEIHTPTEGFKWNQLGELYQWFYQQYAHQSLRVLRKQLKENMEMIVHMLDAMSEKELFEPHQRQWADAATAKAVWPVYKFVHINTIAPFTNFRTKIRKWKKINQL
ncbi:ClbS/DfsB family four-helix bundle protein [Jeotgalibaca ciconiae]|uniref:ClbS/DfsB family four-helix bundle protein n=1 Tax=Jeotgalibaca ciconiae TaxID=2496265 RepID=A0A3S9HBE6_9LACT|nr:ClbS/DfsB family four-helix bundle protein [Jeotgalibaca ciconiae]AZP04688.1 ClbS/DfsB family four-helix bundle protein [Jeotgalibaca ciconiae]HJB23986.1 ClbS/DfsB family four-helix bundle protein [Candidatus Jeotgalibaca pullicola]